MDKISIHIHIYVAIQALFVCQKTNTQDCCPSSLIQTLPASDWVRPPILPSHTQFTIKVTVVETISIDLVYTYLKRNACVCVYTYIYIYTYIYLTPQRSVNDLVTEII